jgi:hypothetical protein
MFLEAKSATLPLSTSTPYLTFTPDELLARSWTCVYFLVFAEIFNLE